LVGRFSSWRPYLLFGVLTIDRPPGSSVRNNERRRMPNGSSRRPRDLALIQNLDCRLMPAFLVSIETLTRALSCLGDPTQPAKILARRRETTKTKKPAPLARGRLDVSRFL
jgi:hypothetical protein